MIDEVNIKDINLEMIVNERINFLKNNNVFNKDEYEFFNQGTLKAYSEMLVDFRTYSVKEFTEKYREIIKHLNNTFENHSYLDEKECEVLSGYNNAIVFVLSLIEPNYEYDV